ncbi:hypothetical protein [Escherichia coli]|uniref:hypothetical protein n=1 Tax=Escherichia coli TaxID=562 RepID=UPI000D0AE715|nr:hypothetical protein [Escherichia coli]
MQRYDFDIERENEEGHIKLVTVIRPSSIGQWVRFEDAAKLQDKIDALESELEEIRQQGV